MTYTKFTSIKNINNVDVSLYNYEVIVNLSYLSFNTISLISSLSHSVY